MNHFRNTDHRFSFGDDARPPSRVRRIIRVVQRAHSDAVYLNRRLLLPEEPPGR
jgi:hypothetical protein